jgi:hypothetical protein
MSFEKILEAELNALEESGLSRLHSKISNFESGAITAFRGERDLATNKANNQKLKAYLMQKGFSVTAVKGSYLENFGSENQREVSEPSFFVSDHKDTGNLEQTLVALGRMFDQDSVLIVPKGGADAYLIGTSHRDDAWPSYGKREVVGSSKFGKVVGQFLSRVKNRQFAFESVEFPDTINGKRGWHILAESVQKEIDSLD